MSKYSRLAGKRYLIYMKQQETHFVIQKLVAFVLMILHNLAKALQFTGIKKARRVEKANVELEC
jgi:hypothetical protein